MMTREQRREAAAEKKLRDLQMTFKGPEHRTPRSLVEVRRDNAMSATQVAEAIGTGYEYYKNLERGKVFPSDRIKKTLSQIFSCQVSDIAWPTMEDTKIDSLKRWTFQAGQIYVFVPVSIHSGGTIRTETVMSKKRRMRYLRDAGVNHVFEDAKRGGLECFIDAQLMDYAVTAA